MPTSVVAAGHDVAARKAVQDVMSSPEFRVYTSDDVLGVELGGALKNVIALAAGMVYGLQLGDNTTGALLTRGLAEMSRLGIEMGARAETFAGLSGLGDLVTTCVSHHSRNRLVGERIGRGERLSEILTSMSMVAEGVQTTRAAVRLAEKYQVEMPITQKVYDVLFNHKPPADAVNELMTRELKSELCC
jgi:glycerol-3-phosphate dehydrogenase (NAD(P)+)